MKTFVFILAKIMSVAVAAASFFTEIARQIFLSTKSKELKWKMRNINLAKKGTRCVVVADREATVDGLPMAQYLKKNHPDLSIEHLSFDPSVYDNAEKTESEKAYDELKEHREKMRKQNRLETLKKAIDKRRVETIKEYRKLNDEERVVAERKLRLAGEIIELSQEYFNVNIPNLRRRNILGEIFVKQRNINNCKPTVFDIVKLLRKAKHFVKDSQPL